MSSGLRLRRPVFFAAGLRCPVCLRRIALCPVFLSVFRLSFRLPSFFPSSVFLPVFRFSSRLPFFSCRPAFPTARVSHCPCLPLSVFLSARSSPALSGRPPSSVFRLVFLLSFLVFPFIVHRSPLVVRRPLSIPCRPLSIPCRPLPVTCRPLFIARCVARTPSPCRASFRCPSVRITAFVSAESRPACLRELLAVSFRIGFRRSVFPQKCVRPPYLGRRAVSDKITPCVLLSGAIFPARPAILLTIWQRLPFGTTFVQIQGVTGAPDPQGGRIPAARKENGKNINN